MSNILTEKFNTTYESTPFEQIKTEDYLPAFKTLIIQSEAEIDAIVSNDAEPNFENVKAEEKTVLEVGKWYLVDNINKY